MKCSVFGIAIILFGIAILVAYSSIGFGYLLGTKIGLTISLIELVINVLSLFRPQSLSQQEDITFIKLLLSVPLDAEWLNLILLGLGSGIVIISPLYLQDALRNEEKKS